jgi:hypothetical protein
MDSKVQTALQRLRDSAKADSEGLLHEAPPQAHEFPVEADPGYYARGEYNEAFLAIEATDTYREALTKNAGTKLSDANNLMGFVTLKNQVNLMVQLQRESMSRRCSRAQATVNSANRRRRESGRDITAGLLGSLGRLIV